MTFVSTSNYFYMFFQRHIKSYDKFHGKFGILFQVIFIWQNQMHLIWESGDPSRFWLHPVEPAMQS